MNKYMILGIGIGVIITNFFYSIVPNKDVNIDKLVEVEVQKRIKKIDEMQKVEESFKEVVKVEEKKEEEIEYFSKDNSANAVYYIYIADSKDKNLIVKEKERLEEFIETKIDLTADYAYLLSEYPYSIDHSNKILGILDERFGIKAQGLKMVEIDQIKKDKIKITPIKTVKKTKKKKVEETVKENESAKKVEVVGAVQTVENKAKVETVIKTPETIKEAEVPKE